MENEVGGGSGPPVGAEDVGKEGGGGTAPTHPPSLQPSHHPGAAHLAGVPGKGSAKLGRAAIALPSAAWTQSQGGVGGAPPGVSWPGTFPVWPPRPAVMECTSEQWTEDHHQWLSALGPSAETFTGTITSISHYSYMGKRRLRGQRDGKRQGWGSRVHF